MTTDITLTLDLTAKTGRVTDNTDYAALGIVPANFNGRGYGTITFQGDAIITRNTPSAPLINLATGATYFDFDLELDSNGEVANGVYGVTYQDRFAVVAPSQVDIMAIVSTSSFITDGNPWLAEFLEAGNVLTLDDATTVTVVSTETLSGNVLITIEETTLTTQGSFTFDITNTTFADTWSYSGCEQVEACAHLTFDCDYGLQGTWSVINDTDLSDWTLTSLDCTISWPAIVHQDDIVLDEITDLPYTNNRLSRGTYTIDLSEVLTQTQDDGLIVSYTSTFTKEEKVTCLGSMCGFAPCINNLKKKHAEALRNGKVSEYQVYVDNVLFLIDLANIYKNCSEMDSYRETLALIQTELDNAKCDCDCGCDDETLGWVYNAPAETITAITELQDAVFEPTVYNKVLYQNTFLVASTGTLYPNAQDFYTDFEELEAFEISADYFDANPNGNSKKFVIIELTCWNRTRSAQAQIVDTLSENTIFLEALPTENQATTRHKIILTTAKPESTVLTFATHEAFQLSNDDPSNGSINIYYNSNNYGAPLWSLTEGLSLDFTPFTADPANLNTIAYTDIKITAIAIP